MAESALLSDPADLARVAAELTDAAGSTGVVTAPPETAAPTPTSASAPNTAALASLGLTGQEVKVLERLAAGQSNKEIARSLGLSPNTVKTHIAHLFEKLAVSRRTQAIGKARDLQLIP